jgi:hypothetical protein
VTHGTCTVGCDLTPLPQTPDLCSQTQGCMPTSQNGDCYTNNSPWPWLFGGANLAGSTDVSVFDFTPANGGNFMVGGFTSDLLVCTNSQVYLALVSQTTG